MTQLKIARVPVPVDQQGRLWIRAAPHDPSRFISEKEARRMDRFIQLGMAASIEAMRDSGLEVTEANAERIGAHLGSGIGGISTIEATTKVLLEKGMRRVSPFYIPMSIANMLAGDLSIMYGLKGPNLAMVTACSTATHAIGDAARLIEYGDADVMIAGAAEAVRPDVLAGRFQLDHEDVHRRESGGRGLAGFSVRLSRG